jgi:DNA-binding NarL/FixJ family response regulator
VLQAIEMGATDYLFKDDAPYSLCAAVEQLLQPAACATS